MLRYFHFTIYNICISVYQIELNKYLKHMQSREEKKSSTKDRKCLRDFLFIRTHQQHILLYPLGILMVALHMDMVQKTLNTISVCVMCVIISFLLKLVASSNVKLFLCESFYMTVSYEIRMRNDVNKFCGYDGYSFRVQRDFT